MKRRRHDEIHAEMLFDKGRCIICGEKTSSSGVAYCPNHYYLVKTDNEAEGME